ncbi:MAG: hypothetical protein ACYCTE_12575, partial [Acidimicrobiales bacterium]
MGVRRSRLARQVAAASLLAASAAGVALNGTAVAAPHTAVAAPHLVHRTSVHLRRHRSSQSLAGSRLTAQAAPAQHIAPSVSWPSPEWVSPTVTGNSIGYIAQSSPTVATFDGRTIVAVGAENGDVYVADATTGKELPGWPQRMAAPPGASIAIESSPAIAWLDGPDAPPSIVVGSG